MSENNTVQNEQVNLFEEILFHSCGSDGDGLAKSGFSVAVGMFDSKSKHETIKSTVDYYNPVIDIIRTGEVVMVDFIFNNRTDSDLRTLWSHLQTYGKNFDAAIAKNDGRIPTIQIQIVPQHYRGQYGIHMQAPLYWVLQPEHAAGEVKVIRTVFHVASIHIIEDKPQDMEKLMAEVEREEMQREYIEQAENARREEEREYQDERNRMLEEMRKTGRS